MTEFDSYRPESWFCDGLIVVSDYDSPKPKSPVTNRFSPWNVRIPGAALASVAIAAGAILFNATMAAASTLGAMPVPGVRTPAYLVSPKPAALSPLKQINRDFNSLFDGMRSGTKVVALVDTRVLAKEAVRNRDEKVDIDAWAHQLANDVKD